MPKGVYKRNAGGENNPNWRGGKSSHPLYEIYNDLKGRCGRPTHKRYADYGGRGIRVAPEWVADFWKFVADVGERPAGVTEKGRALYSLDRIDNDGNYEPGNVRWATFSEQSLNSRPKALLTVCRRGHRMTEENTYRNPNTGERKCRACSRIHEARRSR